MTAKLRKSLIIYFAAILTPYIAIVLFIRTASIFAILPILFFALITLIISTIRVIRAEQNKPRRKFYWITAVAAVVLFAFSYSFQLTAADWMFFKTRERKLTVFISELKKYNKIKEMSDGQRYWKSINNISIEPNIANVDTSNEFGEKYFLDDILNRESLDKEKYEFFRNLLVKTDLISFTTLEDGTISFTIDGFIDNCYGIAYSETGEQPDVNDCGHIIKWTKIGDNWYSWSTT